jgi:Flp pilus assembly protein TadG
LALGVMEFAYDWYLKQAMANACRDGARYGVMYRVDPVTGARIAPNQLPYTANGASFTQTIQNVVSADLTPVLPANSWTTTPSGTGYSNATSGNPLTVTVSYTKSWSVLGTLLPSAKNMTITAQTTMYIE